MASAPGSAGRSLNIVPVVKPNERRPTYPLTASFLFEYEFRTVIDVEELGGPTPLPVAPAPGVQHLP